MNTVEKKLTNRKNNAIEAFKVAVAALDDQEFNTLNISDANKEVLKKWISAKDTQAPEACQKGQHLGLVRRSHL